jgi:hypothetical protein
VAITTLRRCHLRLCQGPGVLALRRLIESTRSSRGGVAGPPSRAQAENTGGRLDRFLADSSPNRRTLHEV